MTIEDEIHVEFADRCLKSGTSTFYNVETAMEIVRVCAERGIVVLAFDGYWIDGKDIYPTLDGMMSAENTFKGDWEEWVRSCAEGALHALEEYSFRPEYVVELDLRSRQEWEGLGYEIQR